MAQTTGAQLDERVSRLEERVGSLRTDVSNVSAQITALAELVRNAQKTPWITIGSFATLAVLIIGGLVGTIIGPIVGEERRLGEVLLDLTDKYNTLDEGFITRREIDVARTANNQDKQDIIKSVDARVTKDTFEAYQKAQDDRITDLVARFTALSIRLNAEVAKP